MTVLIKGRQRQRISGALSLAGLVLIAGCASTPESQVDQADVPIAATWQAGTLAEAPAPFEDAWLRSWRSPELSLIGTHALARNRDLEIAYSRLEAALALAEINGATGIPTLNASLGASRQKDALSGLFSNGVRDQFTAGLTLNWEVDLWGRLRDQRSAALADAESAAATYAAARLSILSNVARLWFNLIEAEAQLNLAEATSVSFARNARRLRSLYEKGLAESLDYRLLQAQAEAAEANVYARAATRGDLARQLQVLIGAYPDGIAAVPEAYPAFPAPLPLGVPSDLLFRRPDLIAAERDLAAAELRASVAGKARLPSFSLTATAGTASPELEDVLDPENAIWSLLGNLAAPVPDAGRLQAEEDFAAAQYRAALAQYERALLLAFQEVEVALSNEEILRQRLEALARAAQQSDRAEDLAWQRYERGLTDVVTVLEAQRRAFDARSAFLSAQNQLHQNRIALLLALGGQPL